MSTCIHHPIKPARYKCRKCLAPLCLECRHASPDGSVYCSAKCAREFREFQTGIDPTMGRRSRGRISILGSLRTLAIAAVLIAVTYAILAFALGTTDPGEIVSKLTETLRLAFRHAI